jgi:hypothetical protein
MTFPALLALAALAGPPPGPLADLTAALGRLGATAPIRARVEHRLTITSGDEPPGPEGLVRATVAAGPEGLQVGWSSATLAEAEQEAQRRSADPEAATPVRDALHDLQPLDLGRALDAARELLRALAKAELLETRPDVKDGAAATLLVLKVTPPLGRRDRKYVKELIGVARVWIGADGVPLAAEQEVTVRGRAFLVISFESRQVERFRFARSGDRLVATHHEVEQRSEGAGEKSSRRSATEVSLQP